jgi:hypothetical protein
MAIPSAHLWQAPTKEKIFARREGKFSIPVSFKTRHLLPDVSFGHLSFRDLEIHTLVLSLYSFTWAPWCSALQMMIEPTEGQNINTFSFVPISKQNSKIV